MRALHLIAVLFGGWIVAQYAHADILRSSGDVVCASSRNVAVARFAHRYNEDPPVYAALPATVDAGLSADKGTDRRTCTLANGWHVRLRIGSDQALPYGMGGADASEYFSLWVDRRKVISRRNWHPGYRDSFKGQHIVAIVVAPESLWTCAASQDAGEPSPKCTSEPLRLEQGTVDEIEYPPPGKAPPIPGSVRISVGVGDALCGSLIGRGPWNENALGERMIWDLNFSTDLQPDVAQHSWIDTSPLTAIDTQSWTPLRSGNVGRLDIDNDGVVDTVLKMEGWSHAFDGSSWFVFPAGVDPTGAEEKAFGAAMLASGETVVPEDAADATGLFVFRGGRLDLYPNVSPRYVHLDGYTYRGRTYFLAHPTNTEHDPSAILIQPQSKGRFKTICEFQIVRPNF